MAGLDAKITVISEKPTAIKRENGRMTLVTDGGAHEADGVFVFRPAVAMTQLLPEVAVEGGSVVVPVEEVDGIHRIEQQQLQATLEGAHVSNRFTRSVLPFKNRSVRVLDEQLLLAAVARSLT